MKSLQESYNCCEREFISKWAAIKITQSASPHSGETIACINRNIIRSISLSLSFCVSLSLRLPHTMDTLTQTHMHARMRAHARRTGTDEPSAPAGRTDSVQPLWSNKATLAVDILASVWERDLGAD